MCISPVKLRSNMAPSATETSVFPPKPCAFVNDSVPYVTVVGPV
jgi:hypothetical protein